MPDAFVLEAHEVLERTPRVLRSMLEGLSDPWLSADEGPQTFSPADVLGHLIHGEETDWIPRARLILEKGEGAPFVPFDRFGFRASYGKKPVAELLDAFARLREGNLRVLRELDLDVKRLALRGRHPALGTVTMGQLIAAWVVHDLGHVRQVTRVLAGRYRDAVGPWREYLRILDEKSS